MNKPAVNHVIATLGVGTICAALDVSTHSVRYAKTTGSFPASWYDVLHDMCMKVGIACPRNAFNWKPPAKNIGDPQTHGHAPVTRQGGAA